VGERINKYLLCEKYFYIEAEIINTHINALGRIPSVPVEWTEISAAFGLLASCVSEIARVLGYQFQKYQIVPSGSFTKLRNPKKPDQIMDLYVFFLFRC